MRILEKIRQAIREQKYRISSHANEEMSEDDLEVNDLESIILKGEILKKFTSDPRGSRYQVLGKTRDKRSANVVCRFLSSDVLLIITAFLDED